LPGWARKPQSRGNWSRRASLPPGLEELRGDPFCLIGIPLCTGTTKNLKVMPLRTSKRKRSSYRRRIGIGALNFFGRGERVSQNETNVSVQNCALTVEPRWFCCLSGGLTLISTMFTSWYWWGYPPSPLSIRIIGLRGKFRQVFEFKGFNLQSIHNKGVTGDFLRAWPLESRSWTY